ncbi:uncharacterized protein PG998_005507 [Apiospora kogelbergensis]|uniref:uncharacterized protein n=1 Tax=Apiospora kogelbergensis TaxID=1337665 RepID=UPI00312F6E8E
MAKQRKLAKSPLANSTPATTSKPSKKRSNVSSGKPPAPLQPAPAELKPLLATLEEKHAYVFHVDAHPAAFKRKIFAVPVLMNLAIVALFCWRVYVMGYWYLQLVGSTLGYPNETTMVAADHDFWEEVMPEIARRSGHFLFDTCLVVFVWPWPVEFFLGTRHGNPVNWRWNVGFRNDEVVVRRSRRWDAALKTDVASKANESGRDLLVAHAAMATMPEYLRDKTGYLMMNKTWDLDWGVMVDATKMVDRKMAGVTLDTFRLLALVHSEEFGWLAVSPEQDERRRQIFLFRDALSALGKEDLFFRWIELVQFEVSRPEGFTAERQEVVAQEVRDLFSKQNINFDEFWKESVGSDGIAGM